MKLYDLTDHDERLAWIFSHALASSKGLSTEVADASATRAVDQLRESAGSSDTEPAPALTVDTTWLCGKCEGADLPMHSRRCPLRENRSD